MDWKLSMEGKFQSYSWPSGTDSDSTGPLPLLSAFVLVPVSFGLGTGKSVFVAFGLSDARAICHAGMVALPCATPEAPYRRLRASLWSDIGGIVCCAPGPEGRLYPTLVLATSAGTVPDLVPPAMFA